MAVVVIDIPKLKQEQEFPCRAYSLKRSSYALVRPPRNAHSLMVMKARWL